MTIPQIIVDIGFTAPLTGDVLHLGDPVRGVLGTGTLASTDLFTDVSEYVTSVKIRRGASRADGPVLRYEAGTCTISLRNDDRRFDPTNLSGPYVVAGRSQVEPMRAVRVRAVWDGQSYPLFRGFTDDWDVQYDGPDSSFVTVTCFDAFGVFASYDRNESGAVGSGEDTGARIGRILDSVTWPDEDRMIDTGDETVQSTTLGDNTLAELQLTADTELGHLFVDTSGRVRFRRRLAETSDAVSVWSQACFGDEPEDGDTTVNLATNPSVENALTGWSAGGFVAPTVSRSNTRARFGSWSVLAAWPNATSGDLPLVQYAVSGLTPGRTYTFSVYAYVPSGSPSVALIIATTGPWGTSTGDTKDEWVRLSLTTTVNTATPLLQVWPFNSTTTSGQQVYLDGLQIEEGELTDYVDGDQTDGEWDGLAHEVTSRRLPELPCADAPLVSDKQSIANLISIARAGGTAQQTEDSGSRSAYLTRTFQRHDLLMQSDAEALMYAEQVLARSSRPELRFQQMELKPTRDERLWPQALGRQFGDRIRIKRRPPGGGDLVQQEVHIRGVEHETDAEQRWKTAFVLQPAPTITTVVDTFTRTESNGWGTTTSGKAWTVNGGSDSDYSVTSGKGRHTLPSTNSFRSTFLVLGGVNQSLIGDVTVPVVPSGAAITAWLVGRAASVSTFYTAQLGIATSGAASLTLFPRVSGTLQSSLGSASAGTHSAGNTWRVWFEVLGSTLRAKAWRPGVDSEPGWQVTATSTLLTSGDQCGVQSRRETGNTNGTFVDWDNFSATTLHAWV